jgi:hypothetical protein
MTSRVILALAMLISLGAAPVFAAPDQQGQPMMVVQDVRSPAYGDLGARAATPHWTALQWARADHQAPGTVNGNQPDRAEAGSGAR